MFENMFKPLRKLAFSNYTSSLVKKHAISHKIDWILNFTFEIETLILIKKLYNINLTLLFFSP